MTLVRRAKPGELVAVRQVLVRAFDEDRPMNWILQRGEAKAAAFDTFFKVAVEKLTWPFEGVWCDEELKGAALWAPPGKWRLRWYQQVRDLPSWGRAIGWSRLASMGKATGRLTAAHPHAPHYYLLALGVDAPHRGKGVAQALVAPVLAQCDAEQMPAYLEASHRGLVPFYERLGFVVRGEVQLGVDGPVMVPMWREPRPQGLSG